MYYSQIYWTLSYLAFAIAGCISISVFASLLGIPIGTISSKKGFKICAITAEIKKYKSIMKKKKKKHYKLVLLAKSKLNSTQALFPKALMDSTQPTNIGSQNVLRTSPFIVPRTSPKDPIWPSQGYPNLTSWRRPNLTSERHPGKVYLGRPQDVLRTSPGWPWKQVLGTMWGQLLDFPKFLFTFLSQLIRLTKSI